MTASSSVTSSPLRRPPVATALQPVNVPLTRVALAHFSQQIRVWLRFGQPAHMLRLDWWRSVAIFLPGTVFCRVRCQIGGRESARHELVIAQAATPLDALARIPGVRPGARLLLHVAGHKAVGAVLAHLDAIEADGVSLAGMSPAYWRTLARQMQTDPTLQPHNIELRTAGCPKRVQP
ncbi:DUF2840 domain-containing protein [Pseudomonas aeruginosa]|uniref:DUF2840 domain-containing protein n=1 Tax=Pseudomonas aeruginosa TaxID=287 RepID=UPI00383AA2F5